MCMLSMRINALHVCSACASVPYTHAHHALKGPFQIWNFYAYAEHTRKKLMRGTHQFLTRMLSERISSWPVCSGCASVPDAYAQHFLKGIRYMHALVHDAYAQCTHQFLTRMLRIRISSWRACSVHASVPDAHAQCMHQFLTRMLRVYKMNIWKIGQLMHKLSMRARNWCVCPGCTSFPGTHAQGAHQFLTLYAQHAHNSRSIRVRNSIFSIKFLNYPKHWKFKNIAKDTNKWSQKLHEKKIFFAQTQKKSSLKLHWAYA